MQSPKFKFVQPELAEVFTKHLLHQEWKKRVGAQIRKQLVFDPIEYRDYKLSIANHIEKIILEICSGSYQVRASKRYLAEKSKGLCRQMTLVHPLDLLVLERLSRSFYFELRSKCPSKAAFFEPDDGSFIRGFQQIDFQYGSYASWRRFQKADFGFSRENKFIVVTDVANFYDFINFQHLRNIVSSLARMRESILDLLIHILNRLTWTPDFMPLSQVGMPQIETSATRVLANVMLYEVDRVCEDGAALNYARFMDDMDIGVDGIPAAKRIIRDIDLTLQSRQLRLNSAKTQILSSREAAKHFCISENRTLAMFEKFLERPAWKHRMKAILLARYESWLQAGPNGEPGSASPFRRSNGAKIHKYTLKLLYAAGGRAPEKNLLWMVRNDPGMRSAALGYLALSSKGNTNLLEILRMVRSGVFVDDSSLVSIADYLLHARFRRTDKCIRSIRALVAIFEKNGDLGLHSAIFLGAKFLFQAEVLRLIRNNKQRIISDFWLARSAAGIAPIFGGSTHHVEILESLVDEFRSEDADSVLRYLRNLSQCTTLDGATRQYLAARNETFPQGIYFPKVLQLLAIWRNPNVGALLPNLHSTHPSLRADPFFRQMGFSP